MNFEQMTNELTQLYTDLRAGKVEPVMAHELNNTAQSIQSNIRLYLQYAKQRNEAPQLATYFGAKQK